MKKPETIAFDLDNYQIVLRFHGKHSPLVVQFDTPARRFHFAVIALIVNEMKKKASVEFVHIRRFKKELEQLDKALSGKHASKNTDAMWAKINMA